MSDISQSSSLVLHVVRNVGCLIDCWNLATRVFPLRPWGGTNWALAPKSIVECCGNREGAMSSLNAGGGSHSTEGQKTGGDCI